MQGKARRNHQSTTPRIRIGRIASGRAPEGRLFWGIVYFTNPTRTGRGLFLFGGREPALRLRGYAQETGVFFKSPSMTTTHTYHYRDTRSSLSANGRAGVSVSTPHGLTYLSCRNLRCGLWHLAWKRLSPRPNTASTKPWRT